MKITFLDESTVNLSGDMDYSKLKSIGIFNSYDMTSSAKLVITRSRESDIIITNKVKITSEVIKGLSNLKHIAVAATGYNNIDLKVCEEAGVSVSNVPGYSTYSVAQHVFTMILNLATRVHDYNREVKDGNWERSPIFTLLKYATFELHGKTLGTIGFGSIGQEVAKLAQAFGMTVLVYRKSEALVTPYESVTFEEILKRSDVLTLNCPLTNDNRYLINADALNKMKSSAFLINTARGPLVNQSDLSSALMNGIIAGAGIDVLDDEPPKSNPLLHSGIPNLIISPHSAWSTHEARQRLVDEVTWNISAFLKGKRRNFVIA